MSSASTTTIESLPPQRKSLFGDVYASVVVPAFIGLAPGAVGGFCNVVVGHPIDLVKVRQQTAALGGSSEGVGTMLRSIVRTRGVAGLYAGVSAPLVAVVPAFALTFSSYEWAKQAQLNTTNTNTTTTNAEANTVLSLPQVAIAGGVSGVFLALVLGPLERIKCLLQVQQQGSGAATKTFVGQVRECYTTGGVRSLVRGTWLTVARDVPGNAVYFCGYEAVRRHLLAQQPDPQWTIPITLVSGGLAGMMNWIVAIPVDVIKSRWQTSSTIPSVRVCVTQLLATDGWPALFRGLRPALMRAFPANAACFLGVQTTASCIQQWQASSNSNNNNTTMQDTSTSII